MSNASRMSVGSMDNNSEGYNKIVNWLNEATLSTESTVKVDNLRKAQEIIFNSSSSLLDNFLDEVLAFQNDRNADVRKFTVGFIEEACKKDPDILPKVVVNLSLLLQDNSAQVQKRVIQAASVLYKLALQWLSRAKSVTDEMEAAWKVMVSVRDTIMSMVDNDNDGIRTLAVKFLETVVLLQTYPEADSMTRENDFSLEDVPFALKVARRRKLEEEAHQVFDVMVKFHNSPHISSVNLMICMGSLVLIAKMRPQFIGKVLNALETLHINLPPTLTKSQVSSVRKHLKLQLLNLLKHPASIDFHGNITTLLTDLGATHQEVMKAYPKAEDIRKHKLKRQQTAALEPTPVFKRPKLEVETIVEDSIEDRIAAEESAIDITERFIMERLTPEIATHLVMAAMAKLPDVIPPHFNSTYTPIAAAGTKGQIQHLSRLIATQLTAANLGPGIKQVKKSVTKPILVEEEEEEPTRPSRSVISTVITGSANDPRQKEDPAKAKPPPPTLQPSGARLRNIPKLKTLKLNEITKPVPETIKSRMMSQALQRILKNEMAAVQAGVSHNRQKIITTIATTFNKQMKGVTIDYILEDIRRRIDLALSWLYEEHSLIQGFNRCPSFIKQETKPDENYNNLLNTLIQHVIYRSKLDAKDREVLLFKLYLETPIITEEAMDVLKDICAEETMSMIGLKLLQELIIKKPPRQMHFLNALLVHTAHENDQIRTEALSRIVELFSRKDLSNIIEEYAVFYLGFLKLPVPPDVVFGPERGRPVKSTSWAEDTIKACLYLLMALLPVNQKLIHELSRVYVFTSAEVKRVILRLIEQPIKGMGMDSPELLALVEECSKGSETLITRVIQILTDKATPSPALVRRVRDLYHSRVPDVRFLIPVLNGLTIEEVIEALPKLIKLNPAVVKEVFNRLLGINTEGEFSSPITPAELLVALHTIDHNECDLKLVIKATTLCFAERQVYTQEVLALVMQQLMEIDPLPTLLMRTVIQALALYPRLIGFVTNILQRLIAKQVWNQKKVWEGFMKCCQRTKPRCFQVLLQLPAPQLAEVLQECSDLRAPLYAHVKTFTDHQKAHIPKTVMDVITGISNPAVITIDENMEYLPSKISVDIKQEPIDKDDLPPPPGIET